MYQKIYNRQRTKHFFGLVKVDKSFAIYVIFKKMFLPSD